MAVAPVLSQVCWPCSKILPHAPPASRLPESRAVGPNSTVVVDVLQLGFRADRLYAVVWRCTTATLGSTLPPPGSRADDDNVRAPVPAAKRAGTPAERPAPR